jgi:hypothetical protein
MRCMTMVKSAERFGPPPPALVGAIARHGREGGIELRQLFDGPVRGSGD